jgi:hypothetical protein
MRFPRGRLPLPASRKPSSQQIIVTVNANNALFK